MGLPDRGGIYASRGFAYQDYALIDSLFCFIDENNFRGIEVESDNDYEIINQNISVQVKIGKEKLSEISKVIANLPENKDKYLLYFSQLDNQARNFFTNVNDFGSNSRKLSDSEIVNKLKIDKKDIYKVRRCNVKIISSLNSENYVCGIISKWLSKHQINSNIEGILNALLLIAGKARTSQNTISKHDVLKVIHDQKYIPDFTQSLDLINHLLGFKSDIINCINFFKTKVEISIQLEQLRLLIINNNYDALELVNKLADNNPNYLILKDAVYLLFGKKILDNSDKETIANLENFYRLVEGIKCFMTKNYKMAKSKFKKLINTNINTNSEFLLGLTLFNLKDYENAILVMQKAIKGESNKVRSHGLTIIYECKKAQNFFYSDLDELIEARCLNPLNQLAILLELEHHTDFKEFEEAICTFDYLKMNKLTNEEKIGAYMSLVVAEYHLKSDRLHSDMIEFLNLLRDIHSQKSIHFCYIGVDYTELFTLIFNKNIYTFSIGDYTVQVPMQEKEKVGIGIDIIPCFEYAALQLDGMIKDKTNNLTNTFILEHGSPTLFIFVNNNKDLIRILKQGCLSINHKSTREYLCKNIDDTLIRIYLHQTYVTGDLKIGNFSMGFSINKIGRGTRDFQKLYFKNPSNFLIELIYLHNNHLDRFYITIPIESVNVEFE